MVGTPPADWIFSRSISSNARITSHLCIITSFAPPNRLGFRTAMQPVTWKNGTEISDDRCGPSGSGAGGASPRRRKARAPAAPAVKILELTPRWVARAPFGFPVGPDLHRRQRPVGQCAVDDRRTDHILQLGDQRVGDLLAGAGDIDPYEVGAVRQVLGEALIAFGVHQRDLGPGIGEAVFQLRSGPPGVQRRHNRPQGGGGSFNFTDAIDAHGDYVVWMLRTMRERGARTVDIKAEAEIAYAKHCRQSDIATAPLRDCLSYYNGEGGAEPGSLAYYGGGRWHKYRIEAQSTLDPYVFGD